MKILVQILFLLSWPMVITAGIVPVNNSFWDLKLTASGGGISQAIYCDGNGKEVLALPGEISFTEKVFSPDGEKFIAEDFAKLDFTLDKDERVDKKKIEVTFSAGGVAAMDWLRVSKKYILPYRKTNFIVEYTLTNRSNKARKAGLWIKSFLRPVADSGVTIWQPRDGKLTALTHPGNALSDEWSSNPGLCISAVTAKDSGKGVTFAMPTEFAGGNYSWTGNKNGKINATNEMFTRLVELLPGQSITVPVEVGFSWKAAGNIQTSAGKKANKLTADPQSVDNMKKIQSNKIASPLQATLGEPGRYAEFTIANQFLPQIRSVVIPAEEKITCAAVYPVRNKRIDRDRPLASRVIKQSDGSSRILFELPGIAPEEYHYTKFMDNKVYFWRYNGKIKSYRGEEFARVRVVLDAPAEPPVLNAENGNLFYNGDFEKANPEGTFADGNYWEKDSLTRKTFFWESNAGRNNSKGIRLKRERDDKKFSVSYGKYFRAEAGVRYICKMDIKCDNPNRKYVICTVRFYDNNGKSVSGGMNFGRTFDSHDWKTVSHQFTAPENAAYFSVGAQLDNAGVDNTLWLDNIVLEAEDLTFKPISPLEAARKRAINNGYLGLDIVNAISHAYETPHEKWFKPAVFKLPKVLYLCMLVNGRNEESSRRSIVELSQRMAFDYEYIPVLRKGLGLKNPTRFGVGTLPGGNVVEDYTLERIKALDFQPRIMLVQMVDFKLNDADKRLTGAIDKLQKNGAQTVFLNCRNIPPELLGKKKALNPGLALLPQLNPRGNLEANVKNYDKAAVLNFYDSHYFSEAYFPATPPFKDPGGPAFFSRDFPYWEYCFFTIAKELRNRALDVLPAAFTAASLQPARVEFTINSTTDSPDAQIKCEFRSINKTVDKTVVWPAALKKGGNQLSFQLPDLPGGLSIVHYFLTDGKNNIYDAGAAELELPDPTGLSVTFKNPDKIYADDEKVTFTLKSQDVQPGDIFVAEIEDSCRRIICRMEKTAAATVDFSAETPFPRTILYNVRAVQKRNGQIVARTMEEFSKPGLSPDPTAFYAGMWGGMFNLTGMFADLGFDFVSTDIRKDFTWRDVVTLNMRPLVLQGVNIGSPQNFGTYRNDAMSDPVRKPCFSDPAEQANTRKCLEEAIRKVRGRYYGGTVQQLGDEMFLGSAICYSEHCLKDFRAEMAARYGSIAELNRVWQRNFRSFSEVMPEQLKSVQNSDNMAPWLDHKMFMSKVFAEKCMGFRRRVIKSQIPGALVGMSGTQVPGYGYDWAQLMKNIDCTAYYGGIQTTLVNDLGSSAQLAGQWGGGYVGCEQLYETFQRSFHWSSLFKGANTVWNWHGSAFNGDGTPTENLKVYAEEFNLLKSGLARLLLSADKTDKPVAILYSHASFFSALGGGMGAADWQNTQTGWDELLRDLKCDARFITYEQLGDKNFAVDQYKVIILPMALALSDSERQNLVRFAENGGTVIADIYPGVYDEHGRRVTGTVLDKLFPPMGNARLICRTTELNNGIWRGSFRVAESGSKLNTVTNCGRGRGVLFNVMFNSYQALTLGGVGGEVSAAASGTDAYCMALRKAVSKVLDDCNIKAHALVYDRKKLQMPCQSVLKKAGKNYYFGVIRHTGAVIPGRIDHRNAPQVTVDLPVSGVIYDVRTGNLLGKGSTFKTVLPLGYGQLFAILPQEIGTIELTLPTVVKAGSMVQCKVVAQGAESATVYHMELHDPAGKVQKLYSCNRRFESPEGQFAFQIPCNADKGEWSLLVRHVASQKQSVKRFTVK